MLRFPAFLLCCSLILSSCSDLKKITQAPATKNISAIKFIGEYDMPYNMEYNKTTVGGLSGIDYDAKNDQYYFICDDRSDIKPNRHINMRFFPSSNGLK